ncbi:MAG TPA: ATP-binding protein, partial [Armatimonadota bacterium]|nr:ATP-binding protein [Armatimonadota bacterium]
DDFTGRGRELEQFDAKLKSYREKPVWFLEGVGGVGKSELLKTFRQVARQRSLPCAYVDLSADSCLSEAGLLNEITKELGETDFPSFRQVYRRIEKLEKAEKTAADFAEGVLDAGKLVPKGGAVAGYLKDKVTGSFRGADVEVLGDRSNRLFDAFTGDLERYAHEEGRRAPVILMFDTYEQASVVQDDVIRHLALFCDRRCKRVLFIIAGRDKPEWEDFDSALIDDQGLDNLPEAEEYLDKRGITDPALRERILKLTKCFPFFLRMACDIVDAMIETGQTPTIEEFPEREFTSRQVADFLVKRLIERLPKGTERLESAIKILGIPRWFDEAIFAALQGAKVTDVGPDWRALEKTCLLLPTEHSARYRYHDCVRDAILSWWKGLEEEISYHKLLAEYHGRNKSEFCHVRERLYHEMAYQPALAIRGFVEVWDTCLALRETGNLALLLGDMPEYIIDGSKLVGWESADLHFDFGYALSTYPTKRPSVLLAAIGEYELALEFWDEQEFPRDWAKTQGNLGAAYLELTTGDRPGNLRKAIAYYEACVRFYTKQAFPREWAMMQNNLGEACRELSAIDKTVDVGEATGRFEAALTIFDVRTTPWEWALVQNNLGNAYSDLPAGDRGENLKQAIGCFEAALRVYTEKDFPRQWAMTQNNLGSAYSQLNRVHPGKNGEEAIRRYHASLRTYSREAFPREWATTHSNLGVAYSELATGNEIDNLMTAVSHYVLALETRTEAEYPEDWAATCYSLGRALLQIRSLGGPRESVVTALPLIDCAVRGYRIIGKHAMADQLERFAKRVQHLLDSEHS